MRPALFPLIALCSLAGCGLFGDGSTDPGGDDPDGGGAAGNDFIDTLCTELNPIAEGDPGASQAQRSGLRRLNCYRLASGLPPATLHPQLDDAAQSHADYMDATDEFRHDENDLSQDSYTGAQPRDRVLASGYPLDEAEQALFEVIAIWFSGGDPSRAVDEWMATVYHRAPLMEPEIEEIGVGFAGQFDGQLIIAPWTVLPGSAALEPAPFPGPGLTGVPTSWDSDTELPDPAPNHGVVGYPITLSFQGTGFDGVGNSHQITVDPQLTSLDGPAGPVNYLLLQPETDPFLMRTVSLVPTRPYEAESSYDVRIVGTIEGRLYDVQWSFSTGL